MRLEEGKGHVRIAAGLAARGMEHRIEEALIASRWGPPEELDALVSVEELGGASLTRGTELPIALAIAQYLGAQLSSAVIAHAGLERDGTTTPCPGAVVAALTAKQQKLPILCHPNVADRAALVGHDVTVADSLRSAIEGGYEWFASESARPTYAVDMAHIHGQEKAKFAMEVAAAGGHHIVLAGPAGEGKTLLSKALNSILPPLTADECIELAVLQDTYNLLDGGTPQRPFYETGKDVSLQALIGGGSGGELQVGMVTKAHLGVLFIDELPLLRQSCIEGLRVALEDGYAEIQRVGVAARLPAQFRLAAAMNPCRCGPLPTGCICTKGRKRSYIERLSGPVFDRIDIRMAISPLPWRPPTNTTAESSETVRARVIDAKGRQTQRYREQPWHINANLPGIQAERLSITPSAIRALARTRRTHRRAHRTFRVARTVADLRGHERIEKADMQEALALTEGGSIYAMP